MKCISNFLIIFLAVLFAGCARPPVEPSEKEADMAAAKSLKIFSRLITKENYRKMGFESPDEVKKATLDKSIREYIIELTSLREYRDGTNPEKLLVRTHSLVYPVLVEDEVRTSLTIAYRDNKWDANSFGYSNFTKLLAAQLNYLTKKLRLPRSGFFIIRVPALNLVFLGHRTNDKLMVTLVLGAPNYNLIVGDPLPASIVLAKLRSAAASQNNLPR